MAKTLRFETNPERAAGGKLNVELHHRTTKYFDGVLHDSAWPAYRRALAATARMLGALDKAGEALGVLEGQRELYRASKIQEVRERIHRETAALLVEPRRELAAARAALRTAIEETTPDRAWLRSLVSSPDKADRAQRLVASVPVGQFGTAAAGFAAAGDLVSLLALAHRASDRTTIPEGAAQAVADVLTAELAPGRESLEAIAAAADLAYQVAEQAADAVAAFPAEADALRTLVRANGGETAPSLDPTTRPMLDDPEAMLAAANDINTSNT